VSAALDGKNTLADGRVEQGNSSDYPVLRFDEMPQVSVHIVPSTAAPTGVGGPEAPPIAPTVADAIAAATGKRLRNLPFDMSASCRAVADFAAASKPQER
jgi:isoquinoline 1-oxidoreductase beta subunit